MKAAALVALLLSASSFSATAASAPADAPSGTKTLCNDGTYSASMSKKVACSGHEGVKTRYVGKILGPRNAPSAAKASDAAMDAKKK